MPRPSKLTPEIQQKIDENIALGLTHTLAASAAGITYQTFMIGLKGERQRNLENIFSFHNILTNAMRMRLKNFWSD